MRKRRLGVLLGGSVVLILLLAGLYCYQVYMDHRVPVKYTERILGVPVVEDLSFLEDKEEAAFSQNPGVWFEGALVPYSSDGTLYLAQDFEDEKWVGELGTASRESFLCMLPDEAWKDKAGSIRGNHLFQIYLVEPERYYPLKLAVCGMPVMSITTTREEPQDLGDYDTDPDKFCYEPDVLYYGQMQLFNPSTGVSRYEITESGLRYHLRGDSSSSFEKKSYALSLLDAKGANLDASLLGMREENSWKLKCMVADGKKVCEKVACELWEQFSDTNPEVNEAGPRMEYLELVIDNDYVGLYGIVEPVDEKKLELDKNDILYKSTNWVIPENDDFDYAVEHKWRLMTYIRVRYPDLINDYEKVWYPIRDYINTFYHDAGDERAPEQKIYMSNAVDLLLFNQAVSGSDNYFRNLYFAADVSESGDYRMRQIPWDLDLTFGSVVSGGFKDDTSVIYEERAIPYLREKNPELFRTYLQKRWSEARESFLDTDSVIGRFEKNKDFLINSGVTQRENNRWPDYKMTPGLERLEDYVARRLEWLDGYFAEY